MKLLLLSGLTVGVVTAESFTREALARNPNPMVIFTGSEQVMKDVADLISQLDIAVEPELKKEERKRLLGPNRR
jgi:hypothetical protein